MPTGHDPLRGDMRAELYRLLDGYAKVHGATEAKYLYYRPIDVAIRRADRIVARYRQLGRGK